MFDKKLRDENTELKIAKARLEAELEALKAHSEYLQSLIEEHFTDDEAPGADDRTIGQQPRTADPTKLVVGFQPFSKRKHVYAKQHRRKGGVVAKKAAENLTARIAADPRDGEQ